MYLADTSAWHHSSAPAVADVWTVRLAASEICTCAQTRLEILFSARDGDDYDRLAARLAALRQLPSGIRQYRRALDVQRSLAQLGPLHHRSVKIPDLVIAASAEAGGAIVWHYDEDFDRIADITGQPMEWIAPRGSL